MKNAVVSQCALGDGLISMVLSNNLYINGNEVVTFHNGFFDQLQNWFPHLPIKRFPKVELVSELFYEFDNIYVFYDTVDEFIQALVKVGKEKWPEKIKVLHPSFSRSFGKQMFYEDAFFRRDLSVVDNIYNFCESVLKLTHLTKENGIRCPHLLHNRKERNRVAIHSFSAKPGRSWSRDKFTRLYKRLKSEGLDPCFVMSANEKMIWDSQVDKDIKAFGCASLEALAQFIYESGYLIGNDSGMGHMASCLGVPVLTISRSKRTSDLWRPGWGKVEVVCPPMFIPNIKGFRLRDKKWQFFISVKKVFRKFMKSLFEV